MSRIEPNMALHSFDTPIKKRVRAEYREFLKRTILRDKKPSEVRVLCLPGHEAVEIFDVYDRLGIPRSNVYGVEHNREAYDLLVARKLGIHTWYGDVFDYLAGNALNRFKQGPKLFSTIPAKDLVTVDNMNVGNEPAFVVSYETNGVRKEAMIGLDTTVAEIFKSLKSDKTHSDAFIDNVNRKLNMPSGEWCGQSFDIVSLDICGHVTARVMNGISSCFRSKALNDRGVMTMTSLASREQELTQLLIRLGTLMDAIMRSTISDAARDIRPEMVSAFGFAENEYDTMRKERTGLEALALFLAAGNEMLFEMLTIYNKAIAGTLLVEMPRNNIFDSIVNTQYDETAMISRKIERYVYQSDHSRMRTAFIQFRNAKKAVGETGSLMEVIAALMRSLGSRVTEVESPKPVELGREQIMEKIRAGEFS